MIKYHKLYVKVKSYTLQINTIFTMLTFQVTLYIMIAFKLQTFTKKLYVSRIPINNIIPIPNYFLFKH